MDKRDEELLREIKQERHIAASILTGYDDLNPEDWDEYAITERMYK